MPKFAHLPLLLKPDGNGKLSKRDAEKHGFPIFPLAWKGQEGDNQLKGFREEGFLPEAFVNFIALLGWNSGTEQEIFSMDELIAHFSIERINKAGAKFDYSKALWFNQQNIKKLPVEKLSVHLINQAKQAGYDCTSQKAIDIAELLQERIEVISELFEKGKYFFKPAETFVEKIIRKKYKELSKKILTEFALTLTTEQPESIEQIKECLVKVTEENETGVGSAMQLLRVAVTGEQGGPDLITIMHILGVKESANRILNAIPKFNVINEKNE